jgi:hypothetical protein
MQDVQINKLLEKAKSHHYVIKLCRYKNTDNKDNQQQAEF